MLCFKLCGHETFSFFQMLSLETSTWKLLFWRINYTKIGDTRITGSSREGDEVTCWKLLPFSSFQYSVYCPRNISFSFFLLSPLLSFNLSYRRSIRSTLSFYFAPFLFLSSFSFFFSILFSLPIRFPYINPSSLFFIPFLSFGLSFFLYSFLNYPTLKVNLSIQGHERDTFRRSKTYLPCFTKSRFICTQRGSRKVASFRLRGQKSQASHSSGVGRRQVNYGSPLRLIFQTSPKLIAGAKDLSFFLSHILGPDFIHAFRPLKSCSCDNKSIHTMLNSPRVTS
jgi:hypothetical protein